MVLGLIFRDIISKLILVTNEATGCFKKKKTKKQKKVTAQ